MGGGLRRSGGRSARASFVRALLDEHLSKAIAVALRGRELDVVAITERPELGELSDDEVMKVAASEGRAVVTNDVKDFRPIAAQRLSEGAGHGGLMLLPARAKRTRASTGALADAIETVMRANVEGIEDSERWIAPEGG